MKAARERSPLVSSQCKLLLLGIDGATWRVLDPLLQAGKLPHLQRLIARGTSGVLRSFEYSASPVVWTTIATGKMPEGPTSVRVKTARPELRGAAIQLPNGEVRPYESLVNVDEDLSGAHQPEGVVIVAGPGIKQGHKLREAHLADITPTMLALLGLPVGRDMDGKVLVDAIEESFLRAHPVTYIDSYEAGADRGTGEEPAGLGDEEREIVEERLRSLGYL
jgi:hypothetical protein